MTAERVGREGDAGTPPYARADLLAPLGVLVVGLGMVCTIAGVLVPVFFLPGVFIIAFGLLVLAAAGIAAVLPATERPDADGAAR